MSNGVVARRPVPAEIGEVLARTFAEKLGRLFDEVRGPAGRRWENREVVEAINAGGEAKISPSYLSELLSGKKDNPNIWTVKALADFFGQSVEYFLDDRPPAPQHAGLGVAGPLPAPGTTTLGERLNLLFRIAGDPSNAQVAAAVGSSAGTLTAARLVRLRAGSEEDLAPAEVTVLARHFSVPPAVLTDPEVAELLAAQLPALTLMQDEGVRRIAFRAHALPARDRAIVAELLERLTSQDRGTSPDQLDF